MNFYFPLTETMFYIKFGISRQKDTSNFASSCCANTGRNSALFSAPIKFATTPAGKSHPQLTTPAGESYPHRSSTTDVSYMQAARTLRSCSVRFIGRTEGVIYAELSATCRFPEPTPTNVSLQGFCLSQKPIGGSSVAKAD